MNPIVRAKRLEKGLTQDQLSALTGVPQSTISAIEVATKTPELPALLKLSKFFECRIEDLLPCEKTAV